MSKYGNRCECGNHKTPGKQGCDRCETMEARSAGNVSARVGVRGKWNNTLCVNPALTRFLKSRGLTAKPFNR